MAKGECPTHAEFFVGEGEVNQDADVVEGLMHRELKVYLKRRKRPSEYCNVTPSIERELLQLQGDMGRVIGANYSEILKVALMQA